MREDPMLQKNWHPKLTEEQILFALSKNIYEPVGQEYEQFLMELGLDPIKEEPIPVPPIIDNPEPPLGPNPPIDGRPVPPVSSDPPETTIIVDPAPPIPPYSPEVSTPTNDGIEPADDLEPPTYRGPKSPINSIPPVGSGVNIPTGSNSPVNNEPVGIDPIEPRINIPTAEEISNAIEETLAKDEENYVVRITKKIKNKLTKPLLALAIMVMLATGLDLTDNVIFQKITDYVSHTSVQYEIEQDIDIEKLSNDILDSLNMGDYVYLKNGLTMNTNSRLTGVNKTLGKEFKAEGKEEGNYPITGISIVKDGEIVKFIENFNNVPMQQNLGDFINDALKELSLSRDDVNVRLHFGSSTDITRCGWCDSSDVITQELIQSKLMDSAKYKGTVNNFEGSHITVATDHGNVKIPIKKANGEYYQRGDKVIGDDNREYVISNLDVETITDEITREEAVVDGKKLTFDIIDSELYKAVLPLIAAAVAHYSTKKKNKKYADNPHVESFDSEEEYKSYKEEFENAGDVWKRSSGLEKVQRRLIRKRVDEMRVLTDEQKEQLYDIITNCNTEYYTYTEGDKVDIKNGRVLITNLEGQVKDITDIVMSRIKDIGKENEVETIGLLTEELQEGRGK